MNIWKEDVCHTTNAKREVEVIVCYASIISSILFTEHLVIKRGSRANALFMREGKFSISHIHAQARKQIISKQYMHLIPSGQVVFAKKTGV